MKTILLCGGKGERLNESNSGFPKPLWMIGDKPLIWHVMKIFANQGFNDFILCTGFKHEAFVEYFLNNPVNGWTIQFDRTSEEFGTAERVASAMKLADTEMFFCSYGDGLIEIQLHELLKAHQTSGRIASLTAVKPMLPFGILKINESGLVETFLEKPKSDHWINGGFFVFQKGILPFLQLGKMLENEPFTSLAAQHELNAFLHKGRWICMDTYKDFINLNRMNSENSAFWLS